MSSSEKNSPPNSLPVLSLPPPIKLALLLSLYIKCLYLLNFSAFVDEGLLNYILDIVLFFYVIYIFWKEYKQNLSFDWFFILSFTRMAILWLDVWVTLSLVLYLIFLIQFGPLSFKKFNLIIYLTFLVQFSPVFF